MRTLLVGSTLWLLAGAVAGCARLRVPRASVAHEMVYLSDFEQIYQQAKSLTEAWGLPTYKTQDTLRQLTGALQDMARQDVSEGLANFTLDFTLQYDVEIAAATDTAVEKRQPIVVTPEMSLNATVENFCERYSVLRCDDLYSSLYTLVARDWGCQDDHETKSSNDPETIGDLESSLLPVFPPPVLMVEIDGVSIEVPLQANQDLELQVALMCRRWQTPAGDCAKLMDHARNVTAHNPAFAKDTRVLSPVSSSRLVLHVTDPSPTALNPISERVYFDGTWFNGSSPLILEVRRPLCLYYNYQTKPLICGLFPPPEMWYLEPHSLSENYHLVFLAEPLMEESAYPVFLAARHFWMVTPTVCLLDLSLQTEQTTAHVVLKVETRSFDLKDPGIRLCSLLDDHMNCFRPENLDLVGESGAYAHRQLLLRVLLLGIEAGSHVVRMMLLNSFNKCVATSSPLEFTVTLGPDVTPTPRDASLEFEPPGGGHIQRPQVCPHEILTSDLAWICRLWRHEWGRFSQNGEDGVLLSIFYNVGATNRIYVEFGTEDARQCNTRFLREEHGWSGLLMDGRFANATINLQREWISPENINQLFTKYDVPSEFDLLSVDVDFNDYWILDAIDLALFSPRVVVIEVNSHVPPDEARVIKYGGPGTSWDGRTAYFGASVAAVHHWGRENGYSLVYCESHGVNCFLVRDDVLTNVSSGRKLAISDALGPLELHAPPNFFGRGIQYPWPTVESGIREDWVWLDA